MTASNPFDLLLDAKPAFGQESEAVELARLVDASLQQRRVRWLEVGAGNGSNLQFLLNRLAPGREIAATAVEPTTAPLQSLPVTYWERKRIEDYQPTHAFDWINIRHASYYFENGPAQLLRLASWLSPSGGISITHWSSRCFLYHLHVRILAQSRTNPCFTFEDLSTYIEERSSLDVSRKKVFDTQLDRQLLQTNDATALAVYHLARRGRADALRTDEERVIFLRSTLHQVATSRANGILIGLQNLAK